MTSWFQIVLQLAGSLAIFMYGMTLLSDGLQRAAGERLQRILQFITANRVVAVLTGCLITIIIQSSSATTVMTVALANSGLLSLKQSIGVTIGANIGTTIDAFLASLKGEATAKRAAWAHILFNVIGAVWAVIVFRPFLGLVRLVSGYGNGAGAIGIAIASLHTLFNGINTLLFLPFINQYEALLKKLVRER
ncbi:MAG TPA: hypothetical protein DHU26_09375, partial [Spirochaetaceae bacterium]|nr:hypothetical protein [Spirochaetaceae bacterium]